MSDLTLDDLCEPWPAGVAPQFDQFSATPLLSSMRRRWSQDGVIILNSFIPSYMLGAYKEAWQADNVDRPMGWPYNTPYMHVPAVRDLCCDQGLANILDYIIGEPMGVHLNLTGWRSTQRNWHQDGYLNPDTTADWYAAVWFALDDIHPDSGPFQYIPGSHRKFGIIRQDKMLDALTPEEACSPLWPKHSERILTPLFEQAIESEDMKPVDFLAKRGDVLIWHSRLLHRGSVPRDPNIERRSLIAHYSGINHRPDMPAPAQRHGQGWLFPINEVR